MSFKFTISQFPFPSTQKQFHGWCNPIPWIFPLHPTLLDHTHSIFRFYLDWFGTKSLNPVLLGRAPDSHRKWHVSRKCVIFPWFYLLINSLLTWSPLSRLVTFIVSWMRLFIVLDYNVRFTKYPWNMFNRIKWKNSAQ